MKRIVILTDDAKTRRTIHTALTAPDCELLDAPSPEGALERLRESSVACLLVDCNFPGTSREMMHLLQYSAALAAVPVVWMSNYGDRDPIARQMELTELTVLQKPFSTLQLLQRMQQCFWIGPCLPGGVPADAIRVA